jgi:hypothetical protein
VSCPVWPRFCLITKATHGDPVATQFVEASFILLIEQTAVWQWKGAWRFSPPRPLPSPRPTRQGYFSPPSPVLGTAMRGVAVTDGVVEFPVRGLSAGFAGRGTEVSSQPSPSLSLPSKPRGSGARTRKFLAASWAQSRSGGGGGTQMSG